MIKKNFFHTSIACTILASTFAVSAIASTHKEAPQSKLNAAAASASQSSSAAKSQDGLKIYKPSDFETIQPYEQDTKKMVKSVSLLPNESNDKIFVKVSATPGAKAKVVVKPQDVSFDLKETSAGNYEVNIDNVTREMIFNSTFHIELVSGNDTSRTVNSMVLREKK